MQFILDLQWVWLHGLVWPRYGVVSLDRPQKKPPKLIFQFTGIIYLHLSAGMTPQFGLTHGSVVDIPGQTTTMTPQKKPLMSKLGFQYHWHNLSFFSAGTTPRFGLTPRSGVVAIPGQTPVMTPGKTPVRDRLNINPEEALQDVDDMHFARQQQVRFFDWWWLVNLYSAAGGVFCGRQEISLNMGVSNCRFFVKLKNNVSILDLYGVIMPPKVLKTRKDEHENPERGWNAG